MTSEENSSRYSDALTAQATDRGSRARSQAGAPLRRAAMSFIQEQPLLCAALGLAIGAAIAAILPSTDTENRVFGETGDALKDRIGELASEQVESAKAAAAKAAQAAGIAALREGLSGPGGSDAERGLGEKVKRAVTEAASAGAQEFRGASMPRQHR